MKVCARTAAAIMLAAGVAAGSTIQPARAERLVQLYEIARDRDPVVLAARHGATSRKYAATSSSLEYLVRAEGTYDTSTNNQRILQSDNQVFAKGHEIYGDDKFLLQAVQPIFRADLIVRAQRANLEHGHARLELDAAEQGLIARLTETYLLVLAAQDAVRFAEAEERAIGEQLRFAELRERAGTANAADVAEAGERFNQARARLIEARSTLEDRIEGVAVIVGFRPSSFPPLGERLPVLHLRDRIADIWVGAAILQNALLRAKAVDVAISAKDIDAQWTRLLPSVELRGQYDRDISGGSLFGGGSDVQVWRGFVTFRVPLWDSGVAIYATESAKERFRQTSQIYDAERRLVVRNTRKYFEAIQSTPRRIESLRKSLEYSSTALRERRARFDAGLITTIEVLDSIRNYYRGQRDLAAARYEYLIGFVKLKEAAGIISEEDVIAIDGRLVGASADMPVRLRGSTEDGKATASFPRDSWAGIVDRDAPSPVAPNGSRPPEPGALPVPKPRAARAPLPAASAPAASAYAAEAGNAGASDSLGRLTRSQAGARSPEVGAPLKLVD
jgi:outer membrane protein